MGDTVDVTPLFEPLGYHRSPRGLAFLYFRVGHEVRRYHSWELQSLTGLLDLVSNADHWRRAFPAIRRQGIDTGAAYAWLVSQCRAQGVYLDHAESVAISHDKAG